MTSYTDRMAAAVEHCESQAAQHLEVADRFNSIAKYCREKLWHQLTRTVLDFMSDESRGMFFVEIYHKVIQPVDNKLRSLQVARIAVLTAQELSRQNDWSSAKAILENCIENSKDLEANIYLQSKHSLLMLSPLLQQPFAVDTALPEIKANLQQILERIKTNTPILQELSETIEAIVPAAHYESALTYYKLIGPASDYIVYALEYLKYAENTHVLSNDLCLAALTATDLYNLTEIIQYFDLATPWLQELVQAVADGNLQGFDTLTQKYATQIAQQPALVHNATIVREKLQLTALVHLVLSNPRQSIAFADIAKITPHVELLVMRAFSVGWLKGSIDQVDELMEITWVEPARVLTQGQLIKLAKQYDQFSTTVQTQYTKMKSQVSPTLLA